MNPIRVIRINLILVGVDPSSELWTAVPKDGNITLKVSTEFVLRI